MKKILNQFNNFCYLRTSFDLKKQDLFETTQLAKLHYKDVVIT